MKVKSRKLKVMGRRVFFMGGWYCEGKFREFWVEKRGVVLLFAVVPLYAVHGTCCNRV